MKKVLVAGATGLLGRLVVKELKQRGYVVRAAAREEDKLLETGADEVMAIDLTDPYTVQGVCGDVEAVICCSGASMNINRFHDRKSFYRVDYQGNLALLENAEYYNLEKFVYVSLAEADKLRYTEYADAHEKFVEALKASKLKHTVVRPTGFFGFHLEILKFAKKGRGLVIGKGDCRTNPIHESDVARACVDALDSDEEEIPLGGPETFTRKETVEMAFAALNRKPSLMSIPPALFKLLIAPLRLVNRRIYALMDFGIAVTQIDVIAPNTGSLKLREYFEQAANTI